MRLSTTLSGAALLAALLVAGTPDHARANEAPALEPYQMVRCLQLVQDRIATGDQASLPMQRKLLEMTDAHMRKANPSAFKDPKNFRALLIYAMSGGNPRTIELVASRLTLEEADLDLAKGIINYLRGQPKAAAIALGAVEPLTQKSEIGAFLALVKGSLNVAEEPEKALKLLDQARLLSPGTLVEEAALRRSILVASRLGDGARFLRTSVQYVRNYLRSPYASQFADAFVGGVITLHGSINLEALADITGLMDAEQERVIYLRIARRAAIDGLTDVSVFASDKAKQRRSGDREEGDPRALLYSGLSAVTSGTAEEMIRSLGSIDRDKLSKGDRMLLDAAEAVAAEMTSAVPASARPGPRRDDIATSPVDPVEMVEPASTDADPMIPDAVEEASQPTTAPSTAQNQPDAAADETDPKLVEARRTLEAIDDLLGVAPK